MQISRNFHAYSTTFSREKNLKIFFLEIKLGIFLEIYVSRVSLFLLLFAQKSWILRFSVLAAMAQKPRQQGIIYLTFFKVFDLLMLCSIKEWGLLLLC